MTAASERPSQGPPTATAVRSDAARNRRRMVAAVLELFAESGRIPPMEHVAAKAGVGKATLYRSYRTIDSLLAAAAHHQLLELRGISQRRVDRGGDALQVLVDVVYGIVDYNRERGLYLEVVRRGNLAAEIREALAGTNAPLQAAMTACQEQGLLLRDDVTYADLQMMSSGCSLNLSLTRASQQRWDRAGYLVLTAIGVPHDRADRSTRSPRRRSTADAT